MGCVLRKEKSQLGKNLKDLMKKSKFLDSKIVFLGDAGVGKSSIAQRYCHNTFTESYEVTIGSAYLQTELLLNSNRILKMHLWDTGGEERFRAMAPHYYRNASAAIIVYDISNLKSFDSAEYWVTQLDKLIKTESLVICVVGNKSDISNEKKKVNFDVLKEFAEKYNFLYCEVSAKTGAGIKQMFLNLGEKIEKNLDMNEDKEKKLENNFEFEK